jgi:hypothetical protein
MWLLNLRNGRRWSYSLQSQRHSPAPLIEYAKCRAAQGRNESDKIFHCVDC